MVAAASLASRNAAGDDDDEDTETSDDEPLGPDAGDLSFLSRWINPAYLDPANVSLLREKMEQDSSVQLREFLKPEIARCIRVATRREDAHDQLGNGNVPSHGAGVHRGWRAVGPTHKQKVMVFGGDDDDSGATKLLNDLNQRADADSLSKKTRNKGKAAETDWPAFWQAQHGQTAGGLLQLVSEDLFRSEQFARLLTSLTGLRPTAHACNVRRFRPGLDYTVAHHGILTTDPRLDATFCVVDDEGDLNASAWDFGEVGGFECYIAADEDGDVATDEVYNANAEEDVDELLSVSASFNTLSLVHRDEGLMRFVKYVSHLAPSSRWDIAAQYTVEGVADSDEDEDDEEDEEEADGL